MSKKRKDRLKEQEKSSQHQRQKLQARKGQLKVNSKSLQSAKQGLGQRKAKKVLQDPRTFSRRKSRQEGNHGGNSGSDSETEKKRQKKSPRKSPQKVAAQRTGSSDHGHQNGQLNLHPQGSKGNSLPGQLPHGYSPEQRILLVGEGDFSFSLSLALLFNGSATNLVCTCFDSRDTVHEKYDGAADNIQRLTEMGGQVLFGVDGTQLAKSLHVGKNRRKSGERSPLESPFDRVVFNFPHVGLGIKDEAVNIQKNQALLLGFFTSALPLLRRMGEVHVALKTIKPYTLWNVVGLATQGGLLSLKGTAPFQPEEFPGYTHRRTLGFVDGISAAKNEEIIGKAKTFMFAARRR